MAGLPRSSQRPASFHPDFSLNVHEVTFSVRPIIVLSRYLILMDYLFKGRRQRVQGWRNAVGCSLGISPHHAFWWEWLSWKCEGRNRRLPDYHPRLHWVCLCQLFRLAEPQVCSLSFMQSILTEFLFFKCMGPTQGWSRSTSHWHPPCVSHVGYLAWRWFC